MKIDSVNAFITEYFKIDREEGYVLFVRGEKEEHENFLPRVYQPGFSFIEHEDSIFKEAIATFPSEMLAQKTTVEKLILMQHYSFPTRLLDITRNPLVALFFACYTEQDRDGAKDDGKVYVFKVPEKEIKFCDSDTAAILSLEIFQAEKPVNNVLLRFYPNDCLLFNTYFANLRRYFFKLRIAGDTVSIIANLCKHPASFSVGGIKRDCTDPKERELFNDENEIIYLVNEIREEKPYFEAQINYADLNSVVCLHPRMNNPRIIRQDGYFFVFGIDDEKRKPAKIQDEWQLRTITIPKEYKDDIMRQLDMLNINERFLFPDFQHFVYSINEKYRK